MALNRRGNRYKGISNAIEATSKEENVHGLFGVELLRLLRTEHPEALGEGFQEEALRLAQGLFRAEEALLDWLFSAGSLPWWATGRPWSFSKGATTRSSPSTACPRSSPWTRRP